MAGHTVDISVTLEEFHESLMCFFPDLIREIVIGNDLLIDCTGGEWTLTQWVHCEFVVSFEAICRVITQQVCGEFF